MKLKKVCFTKLYIGTRLLLGGAQGERRRPRSQL